jgi:parallel beta-helix repeat protein
LVSSRQRSWASLVPGPLTLKSQASPSIHVPLSGILLALLLLALLAATVPATTSSGDATLTIWDDTDSEEGFQVYGPGQNGTFYARYYNSTSGLPINASGDYCEVEFNSNGNWFNMTFNGSSGLYEINRSSPQTGVFPWNVSCHSQGYDALNDTDYVHVSAAEVTEYADYFRLRIINTNAYRDEFYVWKDSVLFANSPDDYWAKIIPTLHLYNGTYWNNYTASDVTWDTKETLGNNTPEAKVHFHGTKGANDIDVWFTLNMTKNYITIKPQIHTAAPFDDSMFSLNITDIKIANTTDDDNVSYYNASGAYKSFNLSNASFTGAVLESQVTCKGGIPCGSGSYFEFTDKDTGKYAWFVIDPDGRTDDTFYAQGGPYPGAYAYSMSHYGPMSAGENYSMLFYWNDPVYECDSCSDCTSKIAAAASWDTVKLNTSISNYASGTCISFGGKDNITFDCLGNTIDGDNSGTDYGIYLDSSGGGSNNNVIKDCIISDFNGGIYLSSSYYNRLQNITASHDSNGVRINVGGYNNVTNATLLSNGYGLYLYASSQNSIRDSHIQNNSNYGAYLEGLWAGSCIMYSSNNDFHNNYFNNTNNLNGDTNSCGYPNYMNTTNSTGPNVIAGPYIGGNYWATPAHNGFSDTCADANNNGYCDSSYSNFYVGTDYLPLTDKTKPDIWFISPATNASTTSDDWIFVNVSSSESLSECVLEWNNGTWTNVTMTVAGKYCYKNMTSLAEGGYYFRVYGNDSYWNTNATGDWQVTVNFAPGPPEANYSDFDICTDFNSEPDITNVSQPMLGKTGTGLIHWLGYINASGADLNSYVNISFNLISVDSQFLNSTFNSTANLTLFSLPWAQTPAILEDGLTCQSCFPMSYSSGTFSFNVTHFSNYSTGANANLSIWDQNDTEVGLPALAGQNITFFANYTNVTSGLPISGAICNVSFNASPQGPFGMEWNATDQTYQFNRTFDTAGAYSWNASCNATGYEPLNAADGITVTQAAGSQTYTCDSCSQCNKYLSNGTLQSGDTLLLTADLTASSYCIDLNGMDNITLDCGGHKITGPNSGTTYTGINSTASDGANNSIIKNCANISYFTYGIYILNTDNITIQNASLFLNTFGSAHGLHLQNSTNSRIENVNCSQNDYGLYLFYSENNSLTNITSSYNYMGLVIPNSDNNTLNGITTSHNVQYGIYLFSSNYTALNNINSSNNNDPSGVQYGLFFSYSENNNLTNITANYNDYGLNLEYSYNNTLTNINSINNAVTGLMLYYSENNMVMNAIFQYNNNNNVYSQISYYNTLTNITASDSYRGLGFFTSYYNKIQNSTISKNVLGISDNGQNTYSGNQFVHNFVAAISRLNDTGRSYSQGQQINFSINMTYPNGTICPACTYNLTLYPSETINIGKSGGQITGNFTPSRVGIYTLVVNITSPGSNMEIRDYKYFINVTGSSTATYYFRGTQPTHGYVRSPLIDVGTLLFSPPVEEETRECTTWVQASLDEMPESPICILDKVNISVWYMSSDLAEFGIQRYASYDTNTDKNQSLDLAETYTLNQTSFVDINWSMEYPWSLYFFTIKLSGTDPKWSSSDTEPSMANITYMYTTTPEIRYISNTDTLVLSATAQAMNSTNATVVLEGEGSINLTVAMMNASLTYQATLDGTPCNDADCNLTSQSNGILNFTLMLGSEHTLYIEGSDTTPPDLTWSPVLEANETLTAENKTWLFWNFTSSETIGTDGCLLEINGTNHTGAIDSLSCYYNETSLAGNQTRCAYGYANDTSGNLDRTEYRCITTNEQQPPSDSDPPDVWYVPDTPSNNSYTQNQSWVLINLSASEPLDACLLDNGTGNLTMATQDATCWYNLTGQANQTQIYVWVWANDTAGNLNRSGDLNVTINLTSDATPPSPAWLPPTDSNGTEAENVTYITWNLSSTEDISYCEFGINGTNHTATAIFNASADSYCYYNETSLAGNQTRCAVAWVADPSANLNVTPATICRSTNEQQPDAEPPYWSGNATSAVPSYSPSQLSFFNITWQDPGSGIHTVYIETNLSGPDENHTMYTEGGGVYQFNYSAPAGDFYWRSWANDTSGNLNVSDTWLFTIQKAGNPILLHLNGTQANLTASYGETTNASAYVSFGSASLFRNDSPVSNPDIGMLAAGYYVYVANSSGDANHTGNSTVAAIAVDAVPSTAYLFLNSSQDNLTQTYGESVNASACCDYGTPQLSLNGTVVPASYEEALAAGYYNFTLACSGDSNHSASEETLFLDVGRAPTPVFLYLNGSQSNVTADYGNTTNATGYKACAEGSLDLQLNGSSTGGSQHIAMLGAGYWNYTLVFAETQNCSANQTALFVTISPVPSSAYLYLNGSSGDQSYTYGETVNASSCCDYGTATLLRNDTPAGNPDVSMLAAGSWNFTAYCSGDANHTVSSNASLATVGKAPGSVTLHLNSSEGNLTQTYPETINVSAWCGYGSLTLHVNSTLATSPFEAVLAAQYTYNFTAYCSADENHTAAEETLFASVGQGGPGLLLFLNGTGGDASIDEGTTLNATVYLALPDTVELYVNGSLYGSGPAPLENLSLVSTPGMLNVTAYYAGSQNYTAASAMHWLAVNDTTPPSLQYVPPTPANDSFTQNEDWVPVNVSSDEPLGACLLDNGTLNLTMEVLGTYCRYTLGGLANGTQVLLRVWANDTSGNLNRTGDLNVTVNLTSDVSAPGITVTSPGNLTYNTTSVSLNVTTSEPADACVYHLNGTGNATLANGSPTDWYLPLSPGDGSFQLFVYCNDSSGNLGLNASVTFSIDTAPPGISFNQPASNNTVTQNEDWLYVNVTLSEPPSSCLLELNGTNLTMTYAPPYCHYNITGQANQTGLYFVVYANDTSGNLNQSGYLYALVNLTSDATPPYITIHSPANTTYASQSIALNVSASEPVNTWWYQLNSNGTNVTFTPNTTIVTTLQGQNNLTVWANDTSGNQNSSRAYFTLDTLPPAIVGLANGTVNSTAAAIHWTTTEASTSQVHYGINQSNLSLSATNSSLVTVHNVTLTGLSPNATYYYNATSCDAYGNCNTSLPYAFNTSACEDADADGYPSSSCGGTDCDDASVSVHPGATDTCGNSIDEDCSGSDASCASAPGATTPSRSSAVLVLLRKELNITAPAAGTLVPGRNMTIPMTINNTGTLNLSGIEFRTYSPGLNVTVLSPSGTFNLSAGQSSVITVLIDAPPGTHGQFNISISAVELATSAVLSSFLAMLDVAPCLAGESRCSGGSVEECVSGSWSHSSDCDAGCLDGACVQPACSPGESRCSSPTARQACSADGLSWLPPQECPAGCSDGACASAFDPAMLVMPAALAVALSAAVAAAYALRRGRPGTGRPGGKGSGKDVLDDLLGDVFPNARERWRQLGYMEGMRASGRTGSEASGPAGPEIEGYFDAGNTREAGQEPEDVLRRMLGIRKPGQPRPEIEELFDVRNAIRDANRRPRRPSFPRSRKG